MQKNWKTTETLHIGTHLRALDESYLMSTNITGFRWFSQIFALWTKVTSALEGLKHGIEVMSVRGAVVSYEYNLGYRGKHHAHIISAWCGSC